MEVALNFKNSSAKIYLNLGGSLQELFLDGKCLIQDESKFYKDNYASAVLFPFVSRIEDGKYSFFNKDYELYCNDDKFNNAIHGLIYNKNFSVISKKESADSSSVVIEYEAIEKNIGFPFLYKIQVEYVLSHKSFALNISIENRDNKPFPFTIGWHPYFKSVNLSESKLFFESDKKLELNTRLLPSKTLEINTEIPLEIKNIEFDDCFYLNNNLIEFQTPEYKMLLKSNSKKNYLQVYTPAHRNSVAIEPQTGISNSFNTKEGLQVLNPKEKHFVSWDLKIE